MKKVYHNIVFVKSSVYGNDFMTFKQFLKPDKRKIIFALILIIIESSFYFIYECKTPNCTYETIGDCGRYACFGPILKKFFYLHSKNIYSPEFFFLLFLIIIIFFVLYLISCFVFSLKIKSKRKK